MSHLTLHRLVKAHLPVVLNALGGLPPSRAAPVATEANAAPAAVTETAFTTVGFRQNFNKVHLSIDEAALWLCTDGSHSFGAPDVMQVLLSPVSCSHVLIMFEHACKHPWTFEHLSSSATATVC
jgi:hypothetical protein